MSDPSSDEGPAQVGGKTGDGRHRRSRRSRERILDAVAQALADPELELTVERVAAEAGVSLSTIFRHFGDNEGLAVAMGERIEAAVRPIALRGPFTGNVAARVRDLVDRRNQVFEISGPLRRAALRAHRPGRVERDAAQRAALRNQLDVALGEELGRVGAERAGAIEALLSPASWDELRVAQGLGLGAVARILEQAVLDLLGSEGSAARD